MIELNYDNLKKLVEISNEYNDFTTGYLDKKFEEAVEQESRNQVYVDYLSIFLVILYHSNFEFYKVDEFRDKAIDILNKELDDMPMYLNEDGSIYNWVPIIARWRLSISL